MRASWITIGVLAAGVAGQHRLAAQDHRHEQASPYAGLERREIKALSTEEIAALTNGEGMGMALPAELHGYPGPRHVLELGEMLGLTETQRSEVQAIFDGMQSQAKTLGQEIIGLERELDRRFADGTITDAALTDLLDRIAAARGQLRATHLRAHLRLFSVLTEQQRAHYRQARGYGG